MLNNKTDSNKLESVFPSHQKIPCIYYRMLFQKRKYSKMKL